MLWYIYLTINITKNSIYNSLDIYIWNNSKNMGNRVYDYQSFSSKKDKSFNTNMEFSSELKYIDIDIFNRPSDLEDLNGIECEIDYSVGVNTSKTGIDSLSFDVRSIELELMKDNYPSEDIEYEIDLIPGKNIPKENIRYVIENVVIPSDPTRIEVDMNKSMEPKDFSITITFGTDR